MLESFWLWNFFFGGSIFVRFTTQNQHNFQVQESLNHSENDLSIEIISNFFQIKLQKKKLHNQTDHSVHTLCP